MFDANLLKSAEETLNALRQQHLQVATAESCTGGLIAGCLTSIAGSSDVFDRSWVTYSNAAKHEMLGVPRPVLEQWGAVSAETAAEMATGILKHSTADIALSVTGIAGPGGERPDKPVGLVWFGICKRSSAPLTEKMIFKGDRNEVREAAVAYGLQMIQRMLGATPL